MSEITYRSNSLQNISSGGLQVKYSSNYSRILRYSIDFTHKALNLHKDVSAPELFILQSKVDALMASWDEKYIQYCKRSKVVSGKGLADEMTVEAVEKLESLERILHHTLKVDDRINWNDLKNFSSYNKSNTFPTPEPSRCTDEAPQFNSPKITFWDTILGKKSQKIAAAKLQFDENYKSWEAADKKHQSNFDSELKAWHDEKERFLRAYSDAKQEFLDQQAAENAKVDALVEALESGDAVAFDPDPISGGKIVIQAKRYTRTVGVSAVRDLYGTLLSEGASKGILVTTADYGPDAHKFAQGKPITLLSGSNLLHLLSKHGYQMKIDLREARQELNLSNRY